MAKCSFRTLLYTPGNRNVVVITQDSRRRRNVVTGRQAIRVMNEPMMQPLSTARLVGANIMCRFKGYRNG